MNGWRLFRTISSQVLLVCVLPVVACGDEQAGAAFDGEWSLNFRVSTKPGGETFTTRQGMSVSPYELHFHSAVESFQFQDDRSVKLEVRQNASLSISSTSRFGDVTLWDRQNHRGQMHIFGTGSGERDNRQVKLSIRWGGLAGTGFVSASVGPASSYRWSMSDDGTKITITNQAGTQTLAFELWKSTWELKPESIEKREVSDDVIEETTTYRGRRESRLAPLDPGGVSPPLPVREEIELKQVRMLQLVPRG